MNIVMVRTFVVAASCGSVSHAAAELTYSESTVAYHIREVEKFCRADLFEPHVRGLVLTRRGRAALEVAHRLLRMADELESPSTRRPPRPGIRRTDVVPAVPSPRGVAR